MDHNWKPVGAVMKTIVQRIGEPTWYEVPLQPDLDEALTKYCRAVKSSPETIIAEATRAYLGAAK